MKKIDIDRMFVGELRNHIGPVKITLGKNGIMEFVDEEGGARIIPHPDRRFMYELSLAYQGLMRRHDNNPKKGL